MYGEINLFHEHYLLVMHNNYLYYLCGHDQLICMSQYS